MEISYQNTIEDMVALAEHQMATSPAFQKRRRWRQYGTPLLFLTVFLYLGYLTRKPALVASGVAGALFLFFCWSRAYRKFRRKAVQRLQREKPANQEFRRHHVTVSWEGFAEHTTESRHFYTWASLHGVAFTPDYIFVYNTPATAHIIPRREVGDAEFQKLREEIERGRNAKRPM